MPGVNCSGPGSVVVRGIQQCDGGPGIASPAAVNGTSPEEQTYSREESGNARSSSVQTNTEAPEIPDDSSLVLKAPARAGV